jgi:topoisomerase-4 subunit A
MTAKPKDKIIVFNKRGNFKVIPVEGKTFVDTDVLYMNIFDAERIYTLVYEDTDKNITFIKRFKITSFMQNKEYCFVKAENMKIKYFSVLPEERLKFYFVKKPKQKINEEVVDTKILDVKGYSALGVRVGAGKEVEKIVRLEKKEAPKATT